MLIIGNNQIKQLHVRDNHRGRILNGISTNGIFHRIRILEHTALGIRNFLCLNQWQHIGKRLPVALLMINRHKKIALLLQFYGFVKIWGDLKILGRPKNGLPKLEHKHVDPLRLQSLRQFLIPCPFQMCRMHEHLLLLVNGIVDLRNHSLRVDHRFFDAIRQVHQAFLSAQILLANHKYLSNGNQHGA